MSDVGAVESRLIEVLGESVVRDLEQQSLDVGVGILLTAQHRSLSSFAEHRNVALDALRDTGDPLRGIPCRHFRDICCMIEPPLSWRSASSVVASELPLSMLAVVNRVESSGSGTISLLAQRLKLTTMACSITRLDASSYGVTVAGRALHYHPFLRRGFLGSMNSTR